jgi:hypothetical protein
MYFWMPGFSIEFEVRVISVRTARRHPTTPTPLLASRNGDFKAIHVKIPATAGVPSLALKNVKDFSITQNKPVADMYLEEVEERTL